MLQQKRGGPHTFPPSFAQQRLWFLDQLMPANPFYNIPAALRFPVALDHAVLEESLTELVRRHEALRTTFGSVDGQPVQIVAPPPGAAGGVAVHLRLEDLRALPAREGEATATRLATQEARLPFDLASGPLLRAALLRLGEQDSVFLLTMHHIISDGWSMGVFFRELSALYAAFATGQDSPLPPLPIQYADFALWQRGRLQGAVLAEQLGYWKRRLAGLPLLALPTDRPRPAAPSFQGAGHYFTLPAELAERLRALSTRAGVTLFMTLLAGFAALFGALHRPDRYRGGRADRQPQPGRAGRADRVFREHARAAHGCGGQPAVPGVVGAGARSGPGGLRAPGSAVRDAGRGVAARAGPQPQPPVPGDVPAPEHDHRAAGATAARPGGSSAELPAPPAIEVQRGTATFDLALDMWDGPRGISGRFEYSTDLFDAAHDCAASRALHRPA